MADWTLVRKSENPKYLWLWVAVVGFIGYAVGRIGSILWGYLDILHHWIPAVALMFVAYYLKDKKWWWVLLMAFSIGLFISDLNDALHLKIWGVDDVDVQKF